MILDGCGQQRRAARRPFGGAAALVAVACGPGRPGLVALSSERAGGRSGLRARWCLPPEIAVLLVQDWEKTMHSARY